MGDPFLLILLLVMLGAFMWFASRRQRKAMKATIELHESLQIGDRVHTTSGMEATIAGIDDDTVDLEIAPGVVTTWMKLAIRDRILPDVDEDEDDDDDLGAEDYDEDTEAVELTESDTPADPDRLRKD